MTITSKKIMVLIRREDIKHGDEDHIKDDNDDHRDSRGGGVYDWMMVKPSNFAATKAIPGSDIASANIWSWMATPPKVT